MSRPLPPVVAPGRVVGVDVTRALALVPLRGPLETAVAVLSRAAANGWTAAVPGFSRVDRAGHRR